MQGLSAAVEALRELAQPLGAEHLIETIQPLLDDRPVAPLLEYVLRRLDLDDGNQTLTLLATNGRIREADTERRRIRREELEVLARAK